MMIEIKQQNDLPSVEDVANNILKQFQNEANESYDDHQIILNSIMGLNDLGKNCKSDEVSHEIFVSQIENRHYTAKILYAMKYKSELNLNKKRRINIL